MSWMWRAAVIQSSAPSPFFRCVSEIFFPFPFLCFQQNKRKKNPIIFRLSSHPTIHPITSFSCIQPKHPIIIARSIHSSIRFIHPQSHSAETLSWSGASEAASADASEESSSDFGRELGEVDAGARASGEGSSIDSGTEAREGLHSESQQTQCSEERHAVVISFIPTIHPFTHDMT